MVYSYAGKLVKGRVMKWIMIGGRWRAEPTGRQATGAKWWWILLSFGELYFIPIHLVSSLGKCFTYSSLMNTLLRWSTRYSQCNAFVHAHLPFGFCVVLYVRWRIEVSQEIEGRQENVRLVTMCRPYCWLIILSFGELLYWDSALLHPVHFTVFHSFGNKCRVTWMVFSDGQHCINWIFSSNAFAHLHFWFGFVYGFIAQVHREWLWHPALCALVGRGKTGRCSVGMCRPYCWRLLSSFGKLLRLHSTPPYPVGSVSQIRK